MATIKKFSPNVKPCNNGLFKVNCTIKPNGQQIGKVVMCEIIDEIQVRLISYAKHDSTWKSSKYKNGKWFEKFELIEAVTFYSPN